MSSRSSKGSEWNYVVFQPRQSLWKLVEEFARENERREIKEIVGEDIIDETVDLHKEVCTLLEIWQDYRDENDQKNEELLSKCHFHRLPEPPDMRSNLKKEIQLFVKALRQRSVENGSTDSLKLSRREEGIIDYAFEELGSTNKSANRTRPLTSEILENGRVTPCRPTSSGKGCRSSSSLSDVIESFQEQLNVEDVDNFVERLRKMLLDEKDNLLEDIAFLQNSLFEESHFRENLHPNPVPEPSLQELKELGIKLEKEMMKNVLPPTVRKPSYSSPTRRPQRKRNVVRSSSTPTVRMETEKPMRIYRESGSPKSRGPSPSHHESHIPFPSPPSSAIPKRPGSASRFRKMVLDSRLEES